ncbi:MAG: N-acetylmuramoyl-L-alanine amidase [Firmicutes bacterium]|nr:N-acetylmuramoyl-L-alanine amidase [Bacillota bacterium]
MSKKTIVIDPGHGGKDPGAVANGLIEKEINLDIAQKVGRSLKDYEAEVHLTRNDDSFVSLTDRANMANQLNADYFVSIHVNAGGGSGFESYIHTTENPGTAELRRIVHNRIMDFLSNKGIRDRGTKSANFSVLRNTIMPAVLLENLFIDNPSEAELLKDEIFRSNLALSITAGVAKALSLNKQQDDSSPSYDPVLALKETGLIKNYHQPDSNVTWWEFAVVMNRLLERIKK